MPKGPAVFASCILVLSGANAFQVWSVLAAFLFTDQLPATSVFRVTLWIWLLTALAVVWCGLWGGYLAVRTGTLTTRSLTAFAVMSCIVLKVSGYELGYSSVRLAITIGGGDLHVGVNFVGFLLVWWLASLRRQAERPLRPLSDA